MGVLVSFTTLMPSATPRKVWDLMVADVNREERARKGSSGKALGRLAQERLWQERRQEALLDMRQLAKAAGEWDGSEPGNIRTRRSLLMSRRDDDAHIFEPEEEREGRTSQETPDRAQHERGDVTTPHTSGNHSHPYDLSLEMEHFTCFVPGMLALGE